MHRFMLLGLISSFAILGLTACGGTGGSTGTVIDAKSCSQADVQSAVNQAVAGNVVKIPACTATWGANGSGVSIDKAITLQGAGRGKTTIDISTTAAEYTSGIIRLYAAATVKSMTIRTPTNGNSGTAFNAASNGFRITDIEYQGRSLGDGNTKGYFLFAESYGVVDSCDITGADDRAELIFARGPTDSWQTADSMGSADNLFIEDNSFHGEGYLSDCNSNSRCVLRFNTTTGQMKTDGHGIATNDPHRGVRHMEVYHNTWTETSRYWAAIELRGGSGRVFGNRATSEYAWLILNECEIPADQLVVGDYPIDDQIGVGRDQVQGPRKVGGSDPMYLWDNLAGGAVWPILMGYGEDKKEIVIAADRDYFKETSPFTGSSGVGRGTFAQMTAIHPSKTGVGFWVTDKGSWNTKLTANTSGQLYVWSGSAWVLRYTPYTYPHPQRS